MNLTDAMDCLRTELALTAWPPDAQGCYNVRLGELPVTFSPLDDGEAFTARARVGSVDVQDVERLVDLMARNLFPPVPCAGTLGIDAQGAVFQTLCWRGDRLGPVQSIHSLAHFVGWAQSVACALASGTRGTARHDTPQEPGRAA